MSLLNNEITQQEIRKNLTDYLELNENDTVSPSTIWEAGKAVMKGNIIAISSRLKKQRLLISAEEVKESILRLKNNKSPGVD